MSDVNIEVFLLNSMLFNGSTQMFFAAVKTLPDINIDYPKDTGEFIFILLFNFYCVWQIEI